MARQRRTRDRSNRYGSGTDSRVRFIREFRARTESLPIGQLEGGAAASFLRMPGVLPGSPEWQAVGTNRVVGRGSGVGSAIQGLIVSENAVVGRRGTADVDGTSLNATDNSVMAKFGSSVMRFEQRSSEGVLAHDGTDLRWRDPAKTMEILDEALAGSSFPTTELWDGRPFYRTDHHMNYRYDSGTSGWISEHSWTLHAGENASQGVGYFDVIPYNVPYNANYIGWFFPFDVKADWFSARLTATSTCTLDLRANGSSVSGSTITYSSEIGVKSITNSLMGTISAGNNIAFYCASGTAAYATYNHMWASFRRFET